MTIAAHKFYDIRNRNGFPVKVVEYTGLMDEGRKFCVTSEVGHAYWVKENERTTQDNII